jgi:beta-N-acetylhexosaminidase
MAFNAPYYLDTTEISKLSLYLAAYSKVGPFVEAAVRVWFGELVPRGDPPVDVAGINYDLQHQLAPDPSQTIPLSLLEPDASAALYPPVSVRVQAGPIVDRNNHPVRDGTEVTVYADYAGATYAPPASATTKGGMADTTLRLLDAGQVRCRAESGEARQSEIVTLAIQPLPTATATASPTPTRTATPTDEPTSTPQPTPVPAPTEAAPAAGGGGHRASGVDLLLAAGATLLAAALGYLVLGARRKEPVIVVRWGLLAICGGMLGYVLYALRVVQPESWGILPDLAWVARAAMVVLVAACALLPLIVVAIARGSQKRGQP